MVDNRSLMHWRRDSMRCHWWVDTDEVDEVVGDVVDDDVVSTSAGLRDIHCSGSSSSFSTKSSSSLYPSAADGTSLLRSSGLLPLGCRFGGRSFRLLV